MPRKKKGAKKAPPPPKVEEETEDIDYGATADEFFMNGSDDNEEGDAAVPDATADSQEEDDSDGSDAEEPEEDSEEEDADEMPKVEPPPSANGELCTFDLRNLLAMNPRQVSQQVLYNSKSATKDGSATLVGNMDVNEDYLLEKAADGCSQLIAALWQLPITRSDAGPMAQLPSVDESQIPRSLPPPPPKKETRWEKFAKEKGIAPKEKRSRKVWDEATGTWKFRHGYQKANDKAGEWPIMEVKANEDPYENPWDRIREEKRGRTEHNLENKMRNEERAGNLRKGTTNRVLKSRERTREAGKRGSDQDHPTGVPVDLSNSRKHRGKTSLNAALLASQKSTASLGRFDKMREGEPERKKALTEGKKKRKMEHATDKRVLSGEHERSLKVLKTLNSGGVEREKARKKGQLAKGETAYDYEYNDGLGASSFKKKKGRAGAGKMKKMTKKRVK